MPAQLRASRPRRQASAGPGPAGRRGHAKQGDLRLHGQSKTLMGRSERADRAGGAQEGEPSGRGPRRPGQRGPRAGAERGAPDPDSELPGAGGRRSFPGCRRGSEHRDDPPAEAPGVADRRRPRGGQPHTQPARRAGPSSTSSGSPSTGRAFTAERCGSSRRTARPWTITSISR